MQASRRVSPIEIALPVSRMASPAPARSFVLVDGDHDGGVGDAVLGVSVGGEVFDQLTQCPAEPVAIGQVRNGRLSR